MTISDPLRAFAENLPAGWQLLSFEAMLAEPVRNGIYKTKEFHGRGARVVNMGELFGYDFISGQEMKRVELTADEEKKNGLIDGDLLFARRSLVLEGAGKCSLVVNPPETMTFESSIIRARPKPSVAEPRFLFYLFTSPLGRAIMASIATRTAVSGIRGSDLTQVGLPLPPLPVQRRIAGILSAYDELMENSQRRIRLLEAMARALYREWFVHFRFPGHEKHPRVASPLGDIPQGWEVKKLGELTAYLNRGLSPSYDDNGDSIVINQKCVRDQRLNLEPARRQTKPVPADKRVRFGDVLINSTGVGTLGRVAQVYQALGECTVDTHVTIARPNPETDLDFFGCTLLSHQETFDRLGIGATGQTELSRTSIANVDLVVPPTRIQRRFGELARPMRAAAMTHANQIQNLRRTRDLLLPRLLSGQAALPHPASPTGRGA
jgi:type I restriction enzyme S subunit